VPPAEGPAEQSSGVRFDWAASGAAELARGCAVIVVVDVLSFSTAVETAVARGIRVHPFPWGGQAGEYAARIGAAVAARRAEAGPDRPWSLSPAALRRAPRVADLVLPSPNGSTICAAATATGVPVVAGCLRNASAVAAWLRGSGYGTGSRPVGVVAAGERWPDGSLRPCVEDLLASALILDGLSGVAGGLSVEAATTLAVLAGMKDVPAAVRGSVSGRELARRGYPDDVRIASEVDASRVVPLLGTDAFVPVY
jgi:2-phosphosulfolactate phosphatase